MGSQLTRTHDVDRARAASHDTDAEHPAGVVCSILFRDPARAGDVDQAPPACFRDLNLDQLVAAVTRRRDEYDLVPFFHTRLTDVDAITYRHEVLHDLENQALVHALESFASAMQRVRRRLRLTTKLRYRYERHSWLLHAAQDYIDAVTTLHRHLDSADLAPQHVQAMLTAIQDKGLSARTAKYAHAVLRRAGAGGTVGHGHPQRRDPRRTTARRPPGGPLVEAE